MVALPKVLLVGESIPERAPGNARPWFAHAESTKRLADAISSVFASEVFRAEEVSERFEVRNVWDRPLPASIDAFNDSQLCAARQAAERWGGRMVIATNRVAAAVCAAYGCGPDAIPYCDFGTFRPRKELGFLIGYILHPSPTMRPRFDPDHERIGQFLYNALSFWRWQNAWLNELGGVPVAVSAS